MRVIAGRPDGIGTRLLTFMAARYFVENAAMPIDFVWPSLDDPLYASDNLLKLSSASEIFLEARPFVDMPHSIVAAEMREESCESLMRLHEKPWGQVHTKPLLIEAASKYDILVYDMPYVIDDVGTRSSRESFLDYWRAFNFHPSILQARDEIIMKHVDEPYLAIHMRRGDTGKMLAESPTDFLVQHGFEQLFQRYLPIDLAANLVEQYYDESLPIIVVSEDQCMPAKLSRLMPRRNITGTHGTFQHGGTRQALLDLLVLSGSDCLLSPACSFFSECAVKVGKTANIKASIDIDYLARELFPTLDSCNGYDARLRKSLFFDAAYKTTLVSSEGKEKLLTSAKQYGRRFA